MEESSPGSPSSVQGLEMFHAQGGVERRKLVRSLSKGSLEIFKSDDGTSSFAASTTAVRRVDDGQGTDSDVASRFSGKEGSLLSKGVAALRRADPDAALAYFQAALVKGRDTGEIQEKGNALLMLGDVYYRLGDTYKARESYHSAMQVYETALNRGMGKKRVLERLSEPGTPMMLCQRGEHSDVIALRKATDSLLGQAHACRSLADIASETRDYERAVSLYKKGLVLYQSIGDPLSEAASFYGLGEVRSRLGDTEHAEKNFLSALSLFEGYEDIHGEGITLRQLGSLALGKGDLDSALRYFGKASDLLKDAGDVLGQSVAQRCLGDVHKQKGLDGKEPARVVYLESLRLSEEMGDYAGKGVALCSLGDLCAMESRREEAETLYERALQLSQEHKDLSGQARAISKLGDLRFRANRFQDSMESYAKAIDLFRQLKDRPREAMGLRSLACALLSTGDLKSASKFLKKAVRISRDCGDMEGWKAGKELRERVMALLPNTE